MKKILAIGGAVIKTAHGELKKAIEDNKVEMLIHNGGSIFHDFQIATNSLSSHSYPLEDLLEDYECNRPTSELLWDWIRHSLIKAPMFSVTRLCEDKGIPVLVFTALGCDFWQLFDDDWAAFARKTYNDFRILCKKMSSGEFHFINMGSAVIHPEVFTKVIAAVKPQQFKADVVDFKDMYRPRTRVAKYGTYHKMTHKEFLTKWI